MLRVGGLCQHQAAVVGVSNGFQTKQKATSLSIGFARAFVVIFSKIVASMISTVIRWPELLSKLLTEPIMICFFDPLVPLFSLHFGDSSSPNRFRQI